MVEARRELLEQCLQDVVHSGPRDLRSAPPLLAFLSPEGQPAPSEQAPRRSSFGAAFGSVCLLCFYSAAKQHATGKHSCWATACIHQIWLVGPDWVPIPTT